MGSIEPYETVSGRRYRVRYRTPDHRQTDKRGFKTKRDAEQFAASVEVKKARGEFIDPAAGRISIGSLGEQWLNSRSDLKASTVYVYRSAWRLHVAPVWADRSLASVRNSEVQSWVTDLSNGSEGRKPKSATVVRRCHDILAAIFDVAVRDHLIPSNPARGIKVPRKVSKEHVYLTHDELAALCLATGEHATLIGLLGYTGLRWGEAAGLRVRDINLLRGRLNVSQNAVYVGGEVVVGTPKTYERRSVPFPEILVGPLRQAMAGKTPDDVVFDDHGAYMTTPTIKANSWWHRSVREVGLPPMTIHDLRHTAASLAISAGANVKAVQRMLGHASAAMTLDTYSDLFDDDLDSVAAVLNDHAAHTDVGKMWANAS